MKNLKKEIIVGPRIAKISASKGTDPDRKYFVKIVVGIEGVDPKDWGSDYCVFLKLSIKDKNRKSLSLALAGRRMAEIGTTHAYLETNVVFAALERDEYEMTDVTLFKNHEPIHKIDQLRMPVTTNLSVPESLPFIGQ